MKLVVGCPVYERAWILPNWFDGITQAASEAGVDLQFVFVYTLSSDETLDLLLDNGATVITYNQGTHGMTRDWTNQDRIQTLADARNIMLDVVSEMEFDEFLSLDSDIIMNDQTYFTMSGHLQVVGNDAVSPTVQLAADRSIINAFTRRRDGHYVRCKPGYHGAADVLCAAILMTPELVRDKSVRYDFHPRGEDFAWSAAAKAAGYDLVLCDSWAHHAMEKGKRWLGPPFS